MAIVSKIFICYFEYVPNQNFISYSGMNINHLPMLVVNIHHKKYKSYSLTVRGKYFPNKNFKSYSLMNINHMSMLGVNILQIYIPYSGMNIKHLSMLGVNILKKNFLSYSGININIL